MAIPIGMVCRASITVGGVKIYARDYGKRAFCFFPGSRKEKELALNVQALLPKTKVKPS
jgi:hypothetical protein